MSHEGTTGVMTEVVATEVQAIVQALVSEPNTRACDAQAGAVVEEEGKGRISRAVEAMRVEVEQAASEPSVPAALTQSTSSDVAKVHNVVAATETVAAQAKENVSGAQEGADMAGTAATAMVPTKTARVKTALTKARLKVAKAKKAPMPAKRAESKAVKPKDIRRAAAVKVDAKVRKAKTPQAVAARTVPKKPQQKVLEFTVPEVWRSIVKKNERQGSKRYDVLVCQHAVPANDNTYRVARSCPECRLRVKEYADGVAASRAPTVPRRRKA
jgi:hypothetical protein